MYCECMKGKVLIIVEVAKCVYVKFIFAHLGNVMELGLVFCILVEIGKITYLWQSLLITIVTNLVLAWHLMKHSMGDLVDRPCVG